MPAFKPKNTKKIVLAKKDTITLDNKHTEMINKFKTNNNELIPKAENKIIELKEKFKNSKNIEEKLDIQDEIKNLKNQIKKLKLDEKNYFLNNSNLIFDYFENKKLVSEGSNKTVILNSFFKSQQENNEILNKERSNVQKYLSNVDNSVLDFNSFVCKNDICKSCGKGEMIPVEQDGITVCNKCSNSIKCLVENEKPSYKEPPKEVCF